MKSNIFLDEEVMGMSTFLQNITKANFAHFAFIVGRFQSIIAVARVICDIAI